MNHNIYAHIFGSYILDAKAIFGKAEKNDKSHEAEQFEMIADYIEEA